MVTEEEPEECLAEVEPWNNAAYRFGVKNKGLRPVSSCFSARCGGADDWGGWGAPVALGGLHLDGRSACVSCHPLLLLWKGTGFLFLVPFRKNSCIKCNWDLLPEFSNDWATPGTLVTTFSGHLLCPEGRRIYSPSVSSKYLSLHYCPSIIFGGSFLENRKRNNLDIKPTIWAQPAFLPSLAVCFPIFYNSVF